MLLLMIKNEYYARRLEIKAELRSRGFAGRTYPRTLAQVPADLRDFFEMVKPDAFV